jgi:hypothetical protein
MGQSLPGLHDADDRSIDLILTILEHSLMCVNLFFLLLT